ncbi:UDP-glucose:glycoprotein glucosyltransferase [Cimex lectularius]|uniref:UDP-glucose:glycoprotein glucosyltransferase n=1 Tax=Cimex lectularius TaxID=79782 RepID=A0A8I6S0R1_CIMLE|nr:UDP-glucose:glycoprotein glucosyltransferase [Cimex lectularius]
MEFKSLFLLLLINLNHAYSKKKPKSVTTVIDAKWEITPLALEMAEFLADENPSLYWKFVNSLSSLEPPLVDEKTDKDYYERALGLLDPLLSQPQISLMKFSLSLHVYSPRVEMFCQIAKEKGVVCPAAVELGGELYCDYDEFQNALTEGVKSSNVTSNLIRLDHKFLKGDKGPLTILYGEIGTPEFAKFHKLLSQKATDNELQYVARHWVKERQPRKLRLSGYGVELQLKSTEYKAQDDTKVESGTLEDAEEDEDEEVEGFHFSKLKFLYPDKTQNLDKFRQELLESSSELAPLKVWQFQELSLQAAQRIMSAPKEEALNTLSFISQNFPSQAKSLVKTTVNQDFKNEMRKNQDRFTSSLHLQPSDTALFINGMFFDLETQDIFSILEYIREELRVMEGLNDIGIFEKKVFKSLLTLDLSSTGVDFGLDIRDSAVLWINDIESDKAYSRWSSSLLDLLRPTFPGMIRSVKKNLYNLVIIGDPSKNDVIPLVKLMQSFLVHNAPLRLGLVFAIDYKKNGLEDAGVAMLNAYNYIAEIKDNSQALNFLTDIYAAVTDDIKPEDVHELLSVKFPGHKKDEIFGPDSDYNTGLKLSAEFVEKSGLRKMPQVLLNGVPLPEKSLTSEDFEEAVLSEIVNQTPILQKAVYKGELSDTDNVVDYLMERPNIMPRLNERILTTTKSKYLSLTKFTDQSILDLIDKHLFYGSSKKGQGKRSVHFLSNWLIVDLTTEQGRNLLANSLEQIEGNSKVRTSLIINQKEPGYKNINKIALSVLMQGSEKVGSTLRQILNDHSLIESGSKTFSDYGVKEVDEPKVEWVLKFHAQFVKDVLDFQPGKHGVVSNGRVLGPFEPHESFTQDDFGLLERFSSTSYIDKIYQAILKNSEDLESVTSDMLMKAVSLLASRPESKSRFEVNSFGEEHSVVKLPPASEGSAFSLVAIVDPVSSGAHKVGTILSVLQQVINCDIKIFFNCVEKNSDMPLKSYYRYVLEPAIQFTPLGQLASGPMAKFSNMPGAPLLTQNMLVPDNWMVESIASPHDLDNIKLDQVNSNVHSNFELEYLILEGHCFDSLLGTPPRGLQITLGTERSPTEFDTIVMANLGYFQLKANPGEWTLRLRHGRSAALYDIIGYGHAGVDYPVNSSEIKILLSSFRSHTIKLKVNKKPDKTNVDLLGDEEEQQGLWGSIASTFGGSGDNGENKEEVINIFSVASGHLYERFLKIMMLSVLKHTKTPVKFWFLKNYLSPTLKDFLPRMAKHYGFNYELVQYKWPRWLHQQTEKQRIIWGYKILFLDVLFPLDVKKIIFVDADQVVRADMKELVDLDLGGAPYAYTPFCESRTEMDGFRFWKSGYWRNHLQGRKYHISALYVVDLKRFRRVAAGDRLRGQYQALSQDPNSLSNLDQDLPNNMIHQVAIKSLPQEWLWCETWCDDESKKVAKTIDLCNNPLTKEAKLTAAMRIVSEWKDYDNEIKEVLLKIGETEDHEEENIEPVPKPTPDVHSEL